jgi:hypothetical protein
VIAGGLRYAPEGVIEGMRAHVGTIAAFVALAGAGAAAAREPEPSLEAQHGAPTPAGSPPPAWEYSVSAYAYFFPGGDDFRLGIATADRGPLHLEARYNYEALDTGSLWAGWNWSTGDAVQFGITPMLGAVIGDVDAIAPGFELSLAWKRLDYYLESEIVLDLHERSEDFIYSWSELGVTPVYWLRLGLVGQRTRVYETSVDIQRGVFAQVLAGPVAVGVDWFDPGGDDEFTVATFAIDF